MVGTGPRCLVTLTEHRTLKFFFPGLSDVRAVSISRAQNGKAFSEGCLSGWKEGADERGGEQGGR